MGAEGGRVYPRRLGGRRRDRAASKEPQQRGEWCGQSRTRARKKGLEREEGKGFGWGHSEEGASEQESSERGRTNAVFE